MGRSFDSDAKRWRFRSSLLYQMGNGLEIVTFMCPPLFLLIATLANCFKQVSMLTSSSTRNSFYKSFAGDGAVDNIGDITAKGEAQIAAIDLLGMFVGIHVSRKIGTSRRAVGLAYLALSTVDIFSIYREIKSVVFRRLNAERANVVLHEFVRAGSVPSPHEVAKRERLFLPAKLGFHVFSTASASGASAAQLEPAIADAVRRRDEFLVLQREGGRRGPPRAVVLHPRARSADMLKGLLTLHVLMRDAAVSPSPSPSGAQAAAAAAAAAREEGRQRRGAKVRRRHCRPSAASSSSTARPS